MARARGKIIEFDWDEDNVSKNWIKHRIHYRECEEVFLNKPINIFHDEKHSQIEDRFVAYGTTDTKKKLTVVFTIRDRKIRVISARVQSKRERKVYEQENKKI